MHRTMLKSKIHRATVTQADLHYVGSLTIDEDLMDAADLLPGEQVAVVDITNGARLETYVIVGPRANTSRGKQIPSSEQSRHLARWSTGGGRRPTANSSNARWTAASVWVRNSRVNATRSRRRERQ